MARFWKDRFAAAVGMALEPLKRPTPASGEGKKSVAFASLPSARFIERHKLLARTIGISNPFFRTVEQRNGASTITIEGRSYLNFGWCDYLGLSAHASVVEAVHGAVDKFGTCVSASRMVGGQIPIQLELERELADFLGTEAALAFVSGHATNVSTIGSLVGEGDLVLYDEFAHNSIVVGIRLSGATSYSFAHNNLASLEVLLDTHRANFNNVLIVVEGLNSTEGDIVDLRGTITLKERYGAWLMVDDAHGLGVLGATGRGVVEHCGADPHKVDILMGTLSKSLASCGGFIAGSSALIEVLKYTAPGFVYSVGLLPAMASAGLASLRVLRAEPERVRRAQQNGRLFLEESRAARLDVGRSVGLGMLPVIVGSVARTGRVLDRLLNHGINCSFIIYPGVPINAGRLRFFVTSEHTREEICATVQTVASEIKRFW